MSNNVLKFDTSKRQRVNAPMPNDDLESFALEVFLLVDHEETKQTIKTALGYAP